MNSSLFFQKQIGNLHQTIKICPTFEFVFKTEQPLRERAGFLHLSLLLPPKVSTIRDMMDLIFNGKAV